jgi:hypothetical protein
MPVRAVLTALQAPGHRSSLGPLPTQQLGNKSVNVDKIKHIFIVLVLPTNSVFKL